ncbi:MAG: glycoside hydrolase family 57 protein [Bacteroidota bacterium]|nr:glycoside hydrolase family 57 protein [Bacteroidota bacterium]
MKGVDISYCYTDIKADKESVELSADNCYLPANEIMKRLIHEHNGKFRVTYSISGTALELFQKHRPDVIHSFKQLVKTGCVEIMAETYYHSLSFLHSKKEFRRQVAQHSILINELFGIQPAVFRNTELIYNNQLAQQVADLGFKGILCEGAERILQGRSPNHLYTAPGRKDAMLLLRNARLSDDIAFRFDDTNWNDFPLTAGKFAEWLHAHPKETEVINLLMDYETLGIHKKTGSGIFGFLEAFPAAVLTSDNFKFSVPSGVLNEYTAKDVYDSPGAISREDRSNASCVWSENRQQNNTLKKIYSIENMVLASGSEKAMDTWGRLQAADYFYYMSGESCKAAAYKYHNPFSTADEAFQNYSNIVADFEIALIEKEIAGRKKIFQRASFINAIL